MNKRQLVWGFYATLGAFNIAGVHVSLLRNVTLESKKSTNMSCKMHSRHWQTALQSPAIRSCFIREIKTGPCLL